MEDLLGLSYTMIMMNRPVGLSENLGTEISSALKRVNAGEPVQYVTGIAHFYGSKFFVDRNVLIPRPETEELVNEVLTFLLRSPQESKPVVVDIGTGSGCIPVTIAKNFASTVYGTDISEGALTIAKKNAFAHHVGVEFIKHDILREELPFNDVTVVVSNPPYIGASEEKEMKANVVAFEPHLALFVPDGNVLLFYEHIALAARKALRPGGLLITEINERYGTEVKSLFQKMNFSDVEILIDVSGKNRIVKGISKV
jgi:release factor glutamine methyltransferase